MDKNGTRNILLRNITVRIPKRQITVFTGVSGSGKSSLVFDTIAAEAQRQLNETFTAFVRGFLPNYGHPDIDAIENIAAAIIIDQKRIGGNSRSTVGPITDINPLLRLLFSHVGQPPVGPAGTFSFNEPTTGLHMSDVDHLLHIIDRLVDQGNSVIVIEHDLDVIKNADWIIDLGPDAGSAGGEVVFAGTPEQLLAAEGSITAECVRRDVQNGAAR